LVLTAWAALLWRRGRSVRDAVLAAAADGAFWLVLGTELLSLGHGIGRVGVALWWAIPAVALAYAHLTLRASRPSPPSPLPPALLDRALLAAVLGLLGWAFVQAVLAPPNNVDALSYHLPRQVYWLQQGSVAHYPTSVLRALTMPPLAEYAGLHLAALSGGDRWHNLVQWTAMVGTLVAVTGLARLLGGGACRS
jgi:hypothetical protein